MGALQAGDPIPEFSLESTAGGKTSAKSLRGKRWVLYFYPRDDTPGCTREACGFQEEMAKLAKEGVGVLGVSKDSIASHERFRRKYGLEFHLLSDPENGLAKACGAHGKKKMYGREVLGTIRTTLLVDARGRVEQVWSPVKVDGHAEAVLNAARGAEPPKQDAPKKRAR